MRTFRCGHPQFSWNTIVKTSRQVANAGTRCKFCHYLSMIGTKGKIPVLTFERFTVAHYSGINPRSLRQER